MPSKWIRVSKSNPCTLCDHGDWCSALDDGSLALCMRVESTQPARNGGWLHRLKDRGGCRKSSWRTVRPLESRSAPSVDWLKLAKQLHSNCNRDAYEWLSKRLTVTVTSLRRLRVGWNGRNRSFAFPMREANGNVCGIRYRSMNDQKFSERGGREGLFFQPADIVRDYLIVVEGASDAAAMIDLGFPSVIGRANCTGNISQIVSLCRRLGPSCVLVVPDNDQPGINGAKNLIESLPIGANLLLLPDEIKDVRECIQSTKNADWLRDQIGIRIQPTLSTNGSNQHEQSS
jgi:5S rRNA maturation endonuclease (ribonuclease M5)